MTTTLRGPAAPTAAAAARPGSRAARVLAALGTTLATAAVLVLAPGETGAYAADLGPLRQPGEAAFIAAHRGDRSAAPENTLAAFEAAIASGSDFLETDVRLTADGAPVLLHDDTVDRTTDGSGLVADLTLAQVRGLDAGSWYAPEFAGIRVPTFDDFLRLLGSRPRVSALIELKDDWSVDAVAALRASVYLHGVQSRVVFASFSTRTLDALQAAAPVIPRVLIRHFLPRDPVAMAARFGAIALMTRSSSLAERPGAVEAMHAEGLGVLLYTLNSEERWGEALALGVDGVVTDEPSALDQWIAATAPGT